MRKTSRLAVLFMVAALIIGCAKTGQSQEPTASAEKPSPVTDVTVITEGRIVPHSEVQLALGVGGEVAMVPVAEGEQVKAGALLLQLKADRQEAALAQAEAALAVSQANLAKVRAGARQEQIDAARAAVAAAQAQVGIAQSQVESAQAGVAATEGQIASAAAALSDVRAGATQEERAIAALNVEMARNEIWAAQGFRDGVAGAVKRKQAQGYDLDRAEAGIGLAHVAHEIALKQQSQIEAGPRAGLVSQARAAVEIAEAQKTQTEAGIAVANAQVAAAKASVQQAQAQADLVDSPPTAEDIAIAEAAVAQAEAAVDAARVSLADVRLFAPIDGSVTLLDAKVGEQVSPLLPLVELADLSVWEVRTEDLTEIEVVKIAVGQTVTVSPDALPELQLKGTVLSIAQAYEEKRGDITYDARIRLDETDPRLRWGMTVAITFDK